MRRTQREPEKKGRRRREYREEEKGGGEEGELRREEKMEVLGMVDRGGRRLNLNRWISLRVSCCGCRQGKSAKMVEMPFQFHLWASSSFTPLFSLPFFYFG